MLIKKCISCSKKFTGKNPTNNFLVDIRYRKKCWECSPYGLGNRKPLKINDKKICSKCNKELPIESFYTKSSTSHRTRTPYCKNCLIEYNKIREQKLKISFVLYKGGKCSKCGYSKNISALEFHHLDSEQKEVNIAHTSKTLEKIKPELDKCILVCSNCHREIHNPDKNNLLKV